MKTYNIDIDGVLCENGHWSDYENAIPIQTNIDSINELYDQGNKIRIFTARKQADAFTTVNWLIKHGVKYNSTQFEKPQSDYYIDDKALDFVPYIRPTRLVDKKTLVICLSGGLDSTIAYHKAKAEGKYDKIVCLFFYVGQPYFNKEKKVLESLGIEYKGIDLSFYKDISPDGHIIPNRNAVFANIAALYGDTIWIVGLKYENHYLMHDKNDAFYRLTSLSLSQSTGKLITVETPFAQCSKTDILKYAYENDLLDVVDKTTSCYHAYKHRCGECLLCVRRYVAGMAAGYEEQFTTNPKESEHAKEMVQKYEAALEAKDFSHYSKERIIESLKYLK